jgi:dienelactone hydrolase
MGQRPRCCLPHVLVLMLAPIFGATPATAQEGEEIKNADLQNDPSRASPPTLFEPIHECGAIVAVSGGIRHAEVRIYVNAAFTASAVVQFPSFTSIELPSPLVAGDVVTATQVVDGVETGPSPAVVVSDHRVEYPSGVPRPEIRPDIVYECGHAVASFGHLESSKVTVFRNGADAGSWNVATSWTNLYPAGGRFARDETFATSYEICGERSDVSPSVVAIEQPRVIPPPILDPAVAYEGQEVMAVRGLLNGALTHLRVGGVEAASFATAVDTAYLDVLPWLGRPLVPGEMLSATQELCIESEPSTTVTVEPCASLPAPRIAAPAIGDDSVTVIRAQPGARILVFDAAGNELGDGAAPSVRLYRRLVAGDVVRVIQRFDSCVGHSAYRIPVRCNPFDTIADRSLAPGHVVGQMDYDEGTVTVGADTARVRATVRFPVTVSQDLVPGRRPILFVLHGNHGTHRPASGEDVCDGEPLPEAPSFRGYDYLLDALAGQGYIAVSIDANDLNCLNRRIHERAELIRAHIELWRRAADPANPASPFGGRFAGAVDFGRVVLVGHSRGGDATALLGSRGVAGATIRGVLAIGPTDMETATLDGVPLFVIAPANDLDVVANDGLRIHDRSRGSGSWFRSYIYIHDANHNFFNREWRFHDGCAAGASRMARAAQEDFLRSLALEFADTVTGRGGRFREVAAEEARVAGLRSDMAFWSYERGDDARVDDHENGDPLRNLLGDRVTHTGFGRFEERSFDGENLGAFNRSFLHETNGLLLEWGPAAELSSAIPSGAIATGEFDVLALRIAQVGGPGLPGRSPFDAAVIARDGSGRSATVTMSAAGRVPRPYRRDFWDGGACGFLSLPEEKTVMTSLRVPLACFAAGDKPVNLEDLTEIGVSTGALDSALVGVDNLGFSR